MAAKTEDLHKIILQLRTELDWVARTGLEVKFRESPASQRAQDIETMSSEPLVPIDAGQPTLEDSSDVLDGAAEATKDDTPPPAFEPDPPELPEVRQERFAPEQARVREAQADRPWERYIPEGPPAARSSEGEARSSTKMKEDWHPSETRRSEVERFDEAPLHRQGDRRPLKSKSGFPPNQTQTHVSQSRIRDEDRSSRPELSQTPSSDGYEALRHAQSLGEVRNILGDCQRCKLHGLGRKQIVFGVGNPSADLMFVGEGPGRQEDQQGEPFVGDAGQLLTRIIERGMGLQRDEVYIANIVKCRPPKNRDPSPDEVASCEPFLRAQIQQIKPRIIVALGKYAAQTLLRSNTPISRLRGHWSTYEGIELMPTYHPAYLLRNPQEKRPVWEDVQAVMRKLNGV